MWGCDLCSVDTSTVSTLTCTSCFNGMQSNTAQECEAITTNCATTGATGPWDYCNTCKPGYLFHYGVYSCVTPAECAADGFQPDITSEYCYDKCAFDQYFDLYITEECVLCS
jgi:hypothetical protein